MVDIIFISKQTINGDFNHLFCYHFNRGGFMKIGITNKELIDIYRKRDYSFEVVELENFDDDLISTVDGIVAGRLSNDQIKRAVKLKHIFIPFTGKNGFDLEYVDKLGIEISTSSAHAKYVAERALSLALSILGKITYYDSELRENKWGDRNFSTRVSWNSLSNLRVGLYGYGSIGKILHSYIKPFTEDVVIYSRTFKDHVINVESIEELFDVTDIVFVCVPLNEETEGSINRSILNRNKGRYLVNIARGKVVDEDSLYEALRDGFLKGYASDVWYQYPSKDNPIISPSKYDLTKFNVVMTPHCGGFADDSQTLRFVDTLNKIEDYKKNSK